ncbi:MAG TPA: hypothetical protein DEP72_00095 [Clostridiales bacterium]|nr:MAG: hypothetical protein A2Y18_08365 [Clostridiales bacterium GWD2_32_19]HCC06552.1 hypothetical protein [Clostridiales bacterium]
MGRVDIYKDENGFTLLELIIVIIIMSILSLMAIPIYQNIVNNMTKTNVSTQVKSVLNVAESTARVNLKKTKVRFEQKEIKLILMEKVPALDLLGDPIETWTDEKILEVIELDNQVSIESEKEVVYDVNGVPEEDVIVVIKFGALTMNLSIYKDGRVTLEDII